MANNNPFLRVLWERYRLPGRMVALDAEVLFCPGGLINTPMIETVKTVTMFRNMIPFDRSIRSKYPLGYARFRNWLLERSMLKSMKQADLVIFISKYARNVIQNRVGPDDVNGVTIPHGLSNHFKIPDGEVSLVPNGCQIMIISFTYRFSIFIRIN